MKKPQLFLLHFAGGNCYSFQFLLSRLGDFEVISPELPGRGRRIAEPLVKDFDTAARDMYEQIRRQLTGCPFLLYGHSMGAYLALRVANLLEKDGTPPAYLVVSGNAGPGIKKERQVHLLERPSFIAELEKLGGVPKEVIADEELFGFFEPILRADFEVAENHGLAEEPAVNAPLFAMMGSREEKADQIANWGRLTNSDFAYEILEGDHFFIYKHAGRIAAILDACYGKTRPFLANRRKEEVHY